MSAVSIRAIKDFSSPLPFRDHFDHAFYHSFVNDLENLLETKTWDVYKWLHQPHPTPLGLSGADLWANIVEFGHTQNYMLPQIEARLIQKQRALLERAFASLNPFVLMAGAGTRWAVLNKEIPMLEALHASGVADWDLCPQMVNEATA